MAGKNKAPAINQAEVTPQFATLADPEDDVDTMALAEQIQQAELKMHATPQKKTNIPESQIKKQSTIVFAIRSQDKFIKRAAEAKGWVMNSAANNVLMFNVKWEYSETDKDVYKLLKSNQFYNHFPDSRELTTKQGLNQNLHNLTLPGVDIYDFYPRCYDLSD